VTHLEKAVLTTAKRKGEISTKDLRALIYILTKELSDRESK
jgi:hypothetical protein